MATSKKTDPFSTPTRGDGYESTTARVIEATIQGEEFPRLIVTAGGDILAGDGTALPTAAVWDPILADQVTVTPFSTIAAITVQAALEEIVSEGVGTVDVVSNVASGVLLGRTTGGSGNSEELSFSAVKTALGLVIGTDVQAYLAGHTLAAAEFIIDGGGATITTGVKGFIEIPFAHTITAVRLLADQSGSIVVDIWKDTYANYPPTVADTITASAKPTISSATKSEDTTLTGWTTSGAAGSIYGFNVDSVTSHQRVTVVLALTKT